MLRSFAHLSHTERVDRLQHMAYAALGAYNLPGAQITPLRIFNNAVFQVDGGHGQRYVLRLHRPGYRSISHTCSELRYLQALRWDTGLVVPEPVYTRQGELVTVISGDGVDTSLHCDVLTWLDGVACGRTTELGPRAVYKLGEVLGRLHLHAQHFIPPPDFDLPCWDADGLFTSVSPHKPGPVAGLFAPEDTALFAKTEAQVRALFHHLGHDAAQFGIIHADFILMNCQFSHGRVQVLDFDDCGFGYFLYDMCPLLGNLQNSAQYATLLRAFLAGYRSVRPLDPEHEAHIDLLIAARHATTILWAAGMQRNGGMSPQDLAGHIAYRMQEVRRHLA
jgi:Ser/Thr protein kinase RdoA (MazF antagonist)